MGCRQRLVQIQDCLTMKQGGWTARGEEAVHPLRMEEVRPPRGLCKKCGIRPVKSKGPKKWRTVCGHCLNLAHPRRRANRTWRPRGPRQPWAKFKKSACEYCRFIALHRCQLDVHHLDHDQKNNKENNLLTLCANCHRLISFLERPSGLRRLERESDQKQ